jgi:hypothetical protein
MIGVVLSPDDVAVAEEFFELFKTPWEPAVPGRKYGLVLCTHGPFTALDADVFLVYGSGVHAIDRAAGIEVESLTGPIEATSREGTFPLYGRVALFGRAGAPGALEARGRSLEYQQRLGRHLVRRIGYNLFDEVRYLLAAGQPAAHAMTPTLELHIAMLRQVLVESKVPFLEIPPSPAGHDFVCCLTHDVDFFGIRRHTSDRTMLGFVARGSVGSLVDVVRGRRRLREALHNWLAVCSLPLVWLRVLRDFWRPFEDYARVEDPRRSTFFVVPFRGRPGVGPDGSMHASRAVPYGIDDIQTEVQSASARGSELGIHGIDAWRDADAGRAEKRQLDLATGRHTAGIRMHWLYFDADSPRRLEAAGFTYDSTWGYNEAVGYRAGTSQVFRPAGSEALLELPLSIMDSALFFPSRMNLAPEQAAALCDRIVALARRFGGTLVINWHERSLAPERLWGRFYHMLVEAIANGHRAWFTTGGEAVEWFRWRRGISFRACSEHGRAVRVSARRATIPGGVIRIHRPGVLGPEVEEMVFEGNDAVDVEFENEARLLR